MTIKEFEETKFGANMQVEYDDEVCDIWSVDFGEQLIQIAPEGTEAENAEEREELSRWVRCENVKLLTPSLNN
jgi:hypothetical protein